MELSKQQQIIRLGNLKKIIQLMNEAIDANIYSLEEYDKNDEKTILYNKLCTANCNGSIEQFKKHSESMDTTMPWNKEISIDFEDAKIINQSNESDDESDDEYDDEHDDEHDDEYDDEHDDEYDDEHDDEHDDDEPEFELNDESEFELNDKKQDKESSDSDIEVNHVAQDITKASYITYRTFESKVQILKYKQSNSSITKIIRSVDKSILDKMYEDKKLKQFYNWCWYDKNNTTFTWDFDKYTIGIKADTNTILNECMYEFADMLEKY
jgi:hypothetical protein